jgi:hypothetical protein
MQQSGGKLKKSSSDSKNHFTVVIDNKKHGLYVSKKQKQKGYPFELRFNLTK